MRPIKIMYDYQHPHLATRAEEAVKQLSQDEEIAIRLTLDDGYKLLEKLARDPNQAFVFMHLATNRGGAYNQVRKCRRLTEAILVADSSSFPHGKSEVLQHFDDYIHSVNTKNLREILSNYGFM